jgi:UDP-N-acetylglucosamine 2-epimerase (non-hydrolysing)
MRFLIPFGTRPEVVKLASVVAALRVDGHQVRTVATGQHDDPRLADDFFDDLGLRPDERWELPAGEGARVGALLSGAYDELAARTPDVVMVLGDTHTVPLFGLAARRAGVPVVHVEAGLRSFNDRSLEEVHRRSVAPMASYHFAPTSLCRTMLESEGVAPRRISVVGNPITDALAAFGPTRRVPAERSGVLVTAHRATNVDDPDRLRSLLRCVVGLADQVGRVTFPVHPRTASRLRDAGLLPVLEEHPDVTLTDPLRHRDMLDVVARSRVVVTDSGGLQEEASWLGVPVVVLRRSTPRWEGVSSGTTALVGLDAELALAEAARFSTDAEQVRVAAVPCPYGDGHVGERIAAELSDPGVLDLLRLDEPDFTAGPPPAVLGR